MAKVFFSYSHLDEEHRNQLEAHLASLRHEGKIESWHDRRLLAGSDFGSEIDQQINDADIILLLVSANFLNSRYCYSIEMGRALERHHAKEARVIPVIVKPCDWESTPLGGLLATPRDGKAITTWPNFDEAFTDVAKQIRKVVDEINASSPKGISATASKPVASAFSSDISVSPPRSSNLRLKQSFTEREVDQFRHETFEFIARFFEGSLAELQARNPRVEGVFRQIDANTFTSTIYKDGKKASECSIAMGGMMGTNAITYSNRPSSGHGSSFNEMLTVEHDNQTLYIKQMMNMYGTRETKLTQEGAAEALWAMLIGPLQR
ncbi:toll/interleukin-1 receptor domain-containing protein [Pseudomonas siliginis]|uniref:toll/interleukin-1 receptor domain-containing protein n=1 Tax=Pseudomonas siliginis TaxID=2842346 RepID=UPI002092DE7A|nr:toll/interleukin-1 receptor domain-containing protein [Pseudomonas siliginis]UST92749.1 toll/interleukin-1 receptor domain-containing protein [Pseudomonas siliginis]